MLIIRLIKYLFGKYRRENSSFMSFSGSIKDKKDSRDYVIGSIGLDLPKEVNLKEYVKEVKGQGIQNSCVSHAICSSIELQLQLDNPKRYMPSSERYNYYYGRKASNLFPQDGGMYPRDAIKSAKEDGISIEILCPYIIHWYVEKSFVSPSRSPTVQTDEITLKIPYNQDHMAT